MTSLSNLYPPRLRQQNIDLIKGVKSAASQQEFEQADQRISNELHPSLFAELDWMEMTMPHQQRQNGAQMADDIFIFHLGQIIAQRSTEFDLSDQELDLEVAANLGFYRNLIQDEQRPLDNLGKALMQRFADAIDKAQPHADKIVAAICEQKKPAIASSFKDICDPNWLLQKIDVEIRNAFAQSLNHVTSRMNTKQYLRKIGGEFPQFQIPAIETADDLQQLLTDLAGLGESAKTNAVYELAATCQALYDIVDEMDAAMLSSFSGELAVGYGGCGNCSMMYASSAIVSFDPGCPGLFEGDDNHIYFPTEFNVSTCPFCGEEARADSPALFYSSTRHQVIYNFPRLGQFSEDQAREMHRSLISNLRQKFIDRVSTDEAARFESANEELTYSVPEFLLAIQMGTTVKEEHVALIVRLADGSGMILDSTKGAIIGLTRSEMQSEWATAQTVDIEDALQDEGIGGGPGVKQAMEAFAAGQFEESRDMLEVLYNRHPEDPVVRKNLAAAYFRLGDIESAQRVYRG